jgi:Zn-dependent peptidase ImmA (M78 family)
MERLMMTNNLPIKLQTAERKAADLIERFGICTPEDIRLRDIAYAIGSDVVEGRLDKAAASLTRIGNRSIIRVREEDDVTRKRFSIAHELGHLVLNHFQSLIQFCNTQDMERWYISDLETEANFFASELMLPKTLVGKRCDVRHVNFSPIRKIAQDFRASLTATAIKFVRLCPESCAIICSKNKEIAWSYTSRSWWPRILSKRKLNSNSCAYEYFAGREIPDEPIEMEADVWIDSRGIGGVVEHSIAAPNFGFVLSILWIKP